MPIAPFDMSGDRRQAQPAGGCPLDGNAKGLPTFGQRRQCAKIGGVQSRQSLAKKRGSPVKQIHELSRVVKLFASVSMAKRVIQVHAVDGAGQG